MQLVFYLPIVLGALLALAAVLGVMDVSVDVDLDADADADHDADGEHGAGALELLGVGRAPLGVLVMSACFLFGLSGLAAEVLGAPAWVAALVATAVSLVGTGLIARVFGRLVPTKETYASRKTDLLGRVGTAELAVDARFGVAHVTDAGGARIQIRCRTLDDTPIPRGEPLVVADYDDESDTFLVGRLPS